MVDCSSHGCAQMEVYLFKNPNIRTENSVSCQFFNKWPRKRRLKRWDLRFVHILMGFSVQILSASSRRSVTVIPVVYSPFVSIFTERSVKSYREGWIAAPTAIGS